ncbi:MAG TPA: hypothetical protein VGQ80_19490, partial [Acidimicrobiia bacterium]|nr:hypothetical protein [Acidimicrobiia bacterium]
MTIVAPAVQRVEGEAQSPPRRQAALVGLVSAALAAVVVLHHLGTKPLWLDEAVSVAVASRPLHR